MKYFISKEVNLRSAGRFETDHIDTPTKRPELIEKIDLALGEHDDPNLAAKILDGMDSGDFIRINEEEEIYAL
jgi:hypothetical protein